MRVNARLGLVTLVSAALSAMCHPTPALAAPGAIDEASGPCGFYRTNHDPAGTASRYKHCADTFIMIRIHWSEGTTHRLCVEPWQMLPFWPDQDGHVVVNGYYIPDPPRLLTTPLGTQRCSLSQIG